MKLLHIGQRDCHASICLTSKDFDISMRKFSSG